MMRARKPPPIDPPNPLDGLTCNVFVERNGARVEVPNVPCSHGFAVLKTLLDGFRTTTKLYPELVVDLSPVGDYANIPVDESSYSETRRRPGFR